MRPEIEDPKQLRWIRRSSEKAHPIYKPGPYWKPIAKNAISQLRRNGILDFRGRGNSSALSYSDYVIDDIRLAPGKFRLLKSIWLNLPIVKQTLNAQLAITQSHIRDSLRYESAIYSTSARAAELVTKYQLDELQTLIGNPSRRFTLDGVEISIHYVKMIDAVDQVSSRLRAFPQSVLEIGGGFGATAHLLIESFHVRKYLYVDISPNLYVGTQYLRQIFGSAVFSAEMVGDAEFDFRKDETLEIICILPHQLPQFQGKVDFCWNSHSFVEMPSDTVRNYAVLMKKVLSVEKGSIALVSYEPSDAGKTLDPAKLPEMFGLSAQTWKSTAPNGLDVNQYFVMEANSGASGQH